MCSCARWTCGGLCITITKEARGTLSDSQPRISGSSPCSQVMEALFDRKEIADALSRRTHLNELMVEKIPFHHCEELNKLNTGVVAMEMDSTLLQDICKGQLEDEKLQGIKKNIAEGKSPGFSEDDPGVLCYKGRICVPDVKKIKGTIL
jgi:hypothetical protein